MAQDTSEIDTRLQHPRVGGAVGGEPVAPPIYQSSTYVLPSPELGAEIAASWHPQRFYTRYGSPNVALVESIVADLEGAESAVAVGSGMAAISAAILSHVSAGDHVVAQTAHYTAALSLMTKWLPRQGVAVTQVDQTDIEAFRNAIGPRTRLVYVETPTNPTMALTDLEAVSALAHRQGAIAVADNTFASSFNQRPLALGVDLVVQSATKYLNGHSDVTAGLVMGSRKLVEPVWEYARVHGPVLHPMEAWLLARGLKTYALRIRQHNQSAALVAKALSETSGVARVHYPGLASHPQHGLARRQMPGGYGRHALVRGRGRNGARALRKGSGRAAEGSPMRFGRKPRRHGDSDHAPRVDDLLPSIPRSTGRRRRRDRVVATVGRTGASPGYRRRSCSCALRRPRLMDAGRTGVPRELRRGRKNSECGPRGSRTIFRSRSIPASRFPRSSAQPHPGSSASRDPRRA